MSTTTARISQASAERYYPSPLSNLRFLRNLMLVLLVLIFEDHSIQRKMQTSIPYLRCRSHHDKGRSPPLLRAGFYGIRIHLLALMVLFSVEAQPQHSS